MLTVSPSGYALGLQPVEESGLAQAAVEVHAALVVGEVYAGHETG